MSLRRDLPANLEGIVKVPRWIFYNMLSGEPNDVESYHRGIVRSDEVGLSDDDLGREFMSVALALGKTYTVAGHTGRVF